MKAWLHRRGRKTWQFESEYGGWPAHRTRAGTLYCIMAGTSQPMVWVGKIIGGACINATNELKGREIHFEDGSKWVFPPRNCFGRLKR